MPFINRGNFMKFKHSAFALLLLLIGCQSPVNDMLNNNFVSIKSEKTPDVFVGIWTGNMGPYLTTFNLKDDGSGVFCYSYGTSDVMQKVKYLNGNIFIQDGTKLEIESKNTNSFVAKANYFGGNETTYYQDNNLREASQFCVDKLSI